jgi:tetratricopeptide (TPR) repeat protein
VLFDADVADTIQRLRWQPERHNMLGDIAAAEGRALDAVRHYWKADTTYDGPNGACSICQFDDLGWAWSVAGNADSAIFYFERFLSTPYYARLGEDSYQKGLILNRMAELFEIKGDVVNAARAYREFISLWARADPVLQKKVSAARDRLAQLADIERR